MAQKRLPMRHIREILRLKEEAGLSNGLIAKGLGLSKTTIASYLKKAKQAGLTWPLPEELNHPQLYHRLFQNTAPVKARKSFPDWERIHEELKKKGVTLSLLWQEYLETDPEGYQYSQFCNQYRQWASHLPISMRQLHKAGEKLFVDYSGKKIPIVDAKTGEVKEAEVFVAVLGASSYTYAEATWTQSLPDWTSSHVRTFDYLEGVPQIVVPDNLKSGVTKADRYEPQVNRSYQDLATHYGTVIIPTRTYRPKDKAKVETAVLLAQRWILAALRHRTFYSLAEANAAIAELLEKLNAKPMQKLKKSRKELFEAIDKPALKPLPAHRYEWAEFKVARANIDYHITVDDHYYSIPYQLRGEKLEVRLTGRILEVFFQGKRVASHQRSRHKYQYTTLSEHMPSAHRRYAEWTPSRLISWGNKTDGAIGKLFATILKQKPHPEMGFRACLGIMRLEKKHGKERLIHACQRALFLKTYSYQYVRRTLANKTEQAPLPEPETPRSAQVHENVRGKNYYQEEDNDPGRNDTKDESNEVSCHGPLFTRTPGGSPSPGLKP